MKRLKNLKNTMNLSERSPKELKLSKTTSKSLKKSLFSKTLFSQKSETINSPDKIKESRETPNYKNKSNLVAAVALMKTLEEEENEKIENERAFNSAGEDSCDEIGVSVKITEVFYQLEFHDYEFVDLQFLKKFLKTFPNVELIDFNDCQIETEHMVELADLLKTNKFITTLHADNVRIDSKTTDLIKHELIKNASTMKYFSFDLLRLSFTNSSQDSLEDFNLSNKKISDLSFITKLCWGYTSL